MGPQRETASVGAEACDWRFRGMEGTPRLPGSPTCVGRRALLQSTPQAAANMLKAACGPGCLALAMPCSKVGAGMAPFIMLCLQLACVYNMHLLVSLKQHFQHCGARSYGDVGAHVFGRPGRCLIDACTAFQQLGICSVYFAFISSGVENMLLDLGVDISQPGLERVHVMVYAFVLLLPMSLIRHWSKLSPLSHAANVCVLTGISISLGCVICSMTAHVSPSQRIFKPSDSVFGASPLVYGATIYSFELVANILSIENAMQKPEQVQLVIRTSMFLFCIIMQLVGVLPVLAFGTISCGSLMDELGLRFQTGAARPWVIGANAFLVVSVVLTYPIQLHPVCEITERRLGVAAGAGATARFLDASPRAALSSSPSSALLSDEDTSCGSSNSTTSHRRVIGARLAIRGVLVVGTLFTAICVPDVGLLVGLFGSLTAPILVMMLPPLMAIKTWDGYFWKVFHILIMVLGGAGAVAGSHTAILNIVNRH
mmetsp:Transcript_73599/g.207237  ORF Transcript_73599/g.207237 Transcript_73599/m.207237 type:complete len:484 (+) Transcript_73599:111-1562(+)